MITQFVMILTVYLLLWTGINLWKKGRKLQNRFVRIFSIGLFFIAFAIFIYSVRDIFTQFGFYDIQERLLTIGGIVHIVGAYFLLLFVTKEFGPKYYKNIFYALFFLLLISFALFISGKIFKIGSEIKQAPLEPVNYLVVRNYISDPNGIFILYGIIILISFLILGIILFNILKTPEREIRMKGLLYGLGTWFLIAPMLICALLSPVFARIGYLVGAFLLYKTFNIKIKET